MMLRILAISMFVALLAACGSTPSAEEEPAEAPAPTAPAEPATGSEAGADTEGSGGADAIELESSFEEVLAAVEGLEGQERRDALIAMAQEEGDVNWYTSLESDVNAAVADAYEEATGLGVSVYRAAGETIRSRVVEEATAGFAGADVVENNGRELTQMSAQGILEPFSSPAHDALVEGAARETWTATRFNIFTAAWNTDLVAEGEQPTTYQDLADPAWDGRMALELKDYDWYWAVWHYLIEDQGMTEEEADAYFQQVAQGSDFVSGHTVSRQLVIAGEYALFASDYSYGVTQAAEEGAPIAWQPPIEPLFGRPNGMGLVRNAPNPAAAVTFLEFMLTEGQQVLADNNIDPAREDLLDLGGAEVRIIDIQAYLEEEDEFVTKYEELARLGDEIREG